MAIVAELSGNFPQGAELDQHKGEAADAVWGGEPIASQVIVIGVASVQSAPFTNRTVALRLVAKTTACRYRVGPAPQVAVATDPLLPVSVIENINVRAGWVISAIQDTGAGELDITELG